MNDYLFPLFVSGALLLMLFSVALILFLIIQNRRQKRYEWEKQALELQHQQTLLTTRLEVQEQSITLVSEELHDNVGQLLGLLGIQLNSLEEITSTGEQLKLLSRSQQTLIKVSEAVRHVSHSLNSDLIEEVGLIRSIETEIDQLRANRYNALLTIHGEAFEFSREQNLLIFRIVQESIQNALKHAYATEMSIAIDFASAYCTLSISDNGKGFDLEQAKKSKSLGIRNIFNRAKLLNAEVNILSKVGEGTSIILNIPKVLIDGK